MRDHRKRVARERLGVRQQLVENDANRELVCAMIDGISRDLLGRHVTGRADHHRGVRRQPEHACDSEVQDSQAARAIDHQVGGLDVSMHQLHLVRVSSTRSQLLHPADLVRERDRRLSADEAGQGFASHVLHHDERLRVVLAEVVDRDDVGMTQCGGCACLTRESFTARRAGRDRQRTP